MANTAFRRVFLVAMPIGFGVCVSALTSGLIFFQLFLRMHPSPEIGVTISPLAFSAWIHGTIGLSAFAGGIAAAWFECWLNPRRRLGGVYGFGVSAMWSAAVFGAFWWRIGARDMMFLIWPLFPIQLALIALAGILGQRISRRPGVPSPGKRDL
jgi:hypothetical protein